MSWVEITLTIAATFALVIGVILLVIGVYLYWSASEMQSASALDATAISALPIALGILLLIYATIAGFCAELLRRLRMVQHHTRSASTELATLARTFGREAAPTTHASTGRLWIVRYQADGGGVQSIEISAPTDDDAAQQVLLMGRSVVGVSAAP